MKKLLLSVFSAIAAISAMAAANSPMQVPEYDWADTDTVTYFVAAKSYLTNGKFSYDNGDFVTYEMGICRDGNKVTFTNLFDSYDPNAGMIMHEIPVVGTYDAEAGTITLETEQAAVLVWDRYEALLCAGAVSEDGTFDPDTELVLEVDDDFTTITATSAFGAKFAFGWVQIFGDFTAVEKTDEDAVKLTVLGGVADMGIAYAGVESSKDFSLVNMGGGQANITITVTEGADVFSIDGYDTTAYPFSACVFTVDFTPKAEGTYVGKAVVETESGDTYAFELRGEGVAPFDYNKIVTNGEFRFETDIEYPFMVTEVEHPLYDEQGLPTGETETITVAVGSTGGTYGQAFLKAFFSVPEGKVGHLTFKGHVHNTENLTYVQNSYILIDDDDYYEAFYALTGDFDPKDCEYFLPEGEHYVYFVHLDALSHHPENCMYIWDLDLAYEEPQESGVEILTPEVFMGYGVLDWVGLVEKKAELTIRNTGIEQLSVLSITSDNDAFYGIVPDAEIGLLEELNVPICFEATKAGAYEANITIETNVGSVEAYVEAEAVDEPDYTPLCDEGANLITETAFAEQYPFVVENGVARNITAGRPFAEEAYSSMAITIEVPEGETAYLHFKGHSWGTPEDRYVDDPYWSFGGIYLFRADGNHCMVGFYDNDIDVSEETFVEKEFGDFLFLPEGANVVEFFYEKQGGDILWDDDCLEIYSYGFEIEGSSIQDIKANEGARQEFYDISGKRLNALQNGINIVRTIYSDGHSTVQKIIIRK